MIDNTASAREREQAKEDAAILADLAVAAAGAALLRAMIVVKKAEAAGAAKWTSEQLPLKVALLGYGRPHGIILMPGGGEGGTQLYADVPKGMGEDVADLLFDVAAEMMLKAAMKAPRRPAP